MTTTFAALGVSADIAEALAARGIESPFQIQERVVPEAMRGSDILAKSPTGSGKTLAFALPIVTLLDPAEPRPAALVLVPTRELATQVTDELTSVGAPRGIAVASVYGGVALHAQAKRAAESHVVVATLWALAQQGEVKAETVAEAIAQHGIDAERTDPRAFDL